MLTPWLSVPGSADAIASWSDAAELDLLRLGTVAELDEITDTAVAQPLIVATTLLCARALRLGNTLTDSAIIAGHSIGEVSALAIAGVLEEQDAVRLAAVRGSAMAEACRSIPTGMAAVLGGNEEDVLLAIEGAGLTAANRNAPGQIVVAGSITDLTAFAAMPPDRAKVRWLPVAGAFHSPYMASATERVEAEIAQLSASDPHHPLLSNADGRTVASGSEALRGIARQITSPVRWDLCMQTLSKKGVDQFVEFAPASVLTGIARRSLPHAKRFPINSPADVEQLVFTRS